VKVIRFSVQLAFVSAVIFLGTGCGGINASHSVSPLNFILPGLMQNKPQDETAPMASAPQVEHGQTVAQSL
jgi:hypothetical protein